jgi:glycosyltransferase involved in cell wall biosynthesis
MRILMLAQFYAPIVGGEERHVQDLSRELVRRGHEVAVVTFWHPGSAAFEIDEGVFVHRIRSTMQRADWLFSDQRRHAPPLPDPEALRHIGRIFGGERPDVVHAHNWIVHSFLPLKAWQRTPLVVTLHDYSLRCAQKRLMYQDTIPCSGPGLIKCLRCSAVHYGAVKGQGIAVANWIMGALERRVVDMFLPVSEATAAGNALHELGLPFRVIPNFMPQRELASAADLAPYVRQLPQEAYLLFVGDLSQDKGIEILLAAYAQLVDPPKLLLIGRRHTTTPKTLPANVEILGPWPHAAVMEAWRRSHFGLVPSLTPETFGLVALEAMSSGRPVIAADSGGLGEVVIHGESGLITPPGDVEALAAAMQSLIADPSLRERMGAAAAARAETFSAARIVPQIEEVYDLLVMNQSRRLLEKLAQPFL